MSGQRPIAVVFAAIVIFLSLARPAQVQPAPATAPRPSINTYLPELQRLNQQPDFAGLERLSRQALETLKAALGPDNFDVAAATTWLADALELEGRLEEAEPLYRQSVAIHEKLSGPNGTDVARALQDLATVLALQGRDDQAVPIARQALAVNERTAGPDSPATAESLSTLAVMLTRQSAFAEAEPLALRALVILEKAGRPDDPDVAKSLVMYADVLVAQGRYDDAEPRLRQALAIADKVFGAGQPDTISAENNLGQVLFNEGRYVEAEPLMRQVLAMAETFAGPDHPFTATSINNLAVLLMAEGRYGDADPLYRRALAIDEKTLGPDHPDTARTLNNFAELLRTQARFAEAEPLYRRALAINEAALGPDNPAVALNLNNLAAVFIRQDRLTEAEPLLRQALAVREKALGADHPDTAQSRNNLGLLLRDEGRLAEAEAIFRQTLAANEKTLGPEHVNVGLALTNLAGVLQAEGGAREAEPLFRRALAIYEKSLGPDHPTTATVREHMAVNDVMQANFADAVDLYRAACRVRSSAAGSPDANGEAEIASKDLAGDCSLQLSLSLWGLAAKGGGTAEPDRPDALKSEAFGSAQRATQSAAGEALAAFAALTAARTAGVGAQAQAYEAALLERDGLDQRFASAAGAAGGAAAQARTTLANARNDVRSRIDRLEFELKAKAPLYWDYRSPAPLTLGELQATAGQDAALLRSNEVLVLWITSPGKDRGLVFAVGKGRFAWAQLGLTGDELDAKVKALRAELDPQGSDPPQPFDRATAHDLYSALLGAPQIQRVISGEGVDTLLIVPSGSLTSLPPSLLVVDKPSGSDSDPVALRSTHWLIRDKAIAVLPAVSSLKTLRELLPQTRAQSGVKDDLPLLALADPDFRGDHAIPRPHAGMAVANRSIPTARAASVDGRPKAEVLASLPPLYGTLAEGQALAKLLNAPDRDLLLGPDASKTELLARQADGTLARTRVIAFSTHGLVTGDFTGLTEPALALAHPPANADASDDGLLTASQASALKLNADWVVLSACNTASPETPGAEGLSGLARAFFYAGANSLLVSHWRVRDDAAQRLVTETFRRLQADPHLSKAQALRRSIISLLDDPSSDASQTFASPQAWAPFVVVGEAE